MTQQDLTSWLPGLLGPMAQPLDNTSTGTLNDVTTTSGRIVKGGVRFTGAAPTVTGFASGVSGRRLNVMTVGGPLVLANESASSSAANRIVTGTGANLTVAQGSGVSLEYDGTSERWRVLLGGPTPGGGTAPTGTGFTHITAGVQDAAAKLVENADVHASAAIARSKLASPAADTQVLFQDGTVEAGDAGITYNKTTDVLTVTGGVVVGNSGYVSIGTTSVATTGQLRLRNDTLGAIYARNGADSADLRVLVLDSANRVFLGQSTGVSGVVLEGATGHNFNIGGTTVASVGSTGILLSSAALRFGATPATTGTIRLTHGNTIVVRDSTNAVDMTLLEVTGDALHLGMASILSAVVMKSPGPITKRCNEYRVQDSAGSVDRFIVSSTTWQTAVPIVGLNGPHALSGRATQAMADANQTLASSVYSRRILRFTGALAANRTATFPHPASEDASYEKLIVNDCTGSSLVVSTGTGTTVTLAAAARAVLAFTPDGVMQIAT